MKEPWFRCAGALALALLTGRLAAAEVPAVASAPVRANELGLEVVRLSPRVVVAYGGPWDNGIVAIATRKGIVVVDAPFSKRIGGAFREAIQAELKRSDVAFSSTRTSTSATWEGTRPSPTFRSSGTRLCGRRCSR
ncbi:MAG: hypothetical protein IPF66_23725 [Holophagales bacterium]|nr:hypothetical protein [Holophagales bacterium]